MHEFLRNTPQTMPPSSQALTARQIKSALVALGITQAQLAREFGVHVNTISAAVNHGLNDPTRRKILARLEAEELIPS